jgi:hypothetical protein
MGCWAFFLFYLKGHHLGFCQKPFATSQAQNIKILYKKLEGAANHMQHLLICLFITSAPIEMVLQSLWHRINGATKIKNRFPF